MKSRRFAVRFVHLAPGWRFWAFERDTGFDAELGLDPNGYMSEQNAWRAVARAEKQEAA